MNAPRLVVLACFTVAAASAGLRGAGEGRSDPALRGNWVCTAAVVDGKPLAEGVVKELRLTITSERYETRRAEEVLFDSTYRVDSSKNPSERPSGDQNGYLASSLPGSTWASRRSRART